MTTSMYLHRVSNDKANQECPVCHEMKFDVGTCEKMKGWELTVKLWEASCHGCYALGAGDTEAEALANVKPKK